MLRIYFASTKKEKTSFTIFKEILYVCNSVFEIKLQTILSQLVNCVKTFQSLSYSLYFKLTMSDQLRKCWRLQKSTWCCVKKPWLGQQVCAVNKLEFGWNKQTRLNIMWNEIKVLEIIKHQNTEILEAGPIYICSISYQPPSPTPSIKTLLLLLKKFGTYFLNSFSLWK
jgi:hypothetical protein